MIRILKYLFTGWYWKMAFRDMRKNFIRLILFASTIVIGIGALVSINSFRYNLNDALSLESKNMLGADLVVFPGKLAEDSVLEMFDTMAVEKIKFVRFRTMVQFQKTEDVRLMLAWTINDTFPYYGEFDTDPQKISRNISETQGVIVDKNTMFQYGSELGDSVTIGNKTFAIQGRLLSMEGNNAIDAMIFPPVFLPASSLAETGLVQKGSNISDVYFYRIKSDIDIDKFLEDNYDYLADNKIGCLTPKGHREGLIRRFTDFTGFLSLVGFIALLLGCLGVASTIHVYLKGKLSTIALFRCIGLNSKQTFTIYLIQILVLGAIGSVLGCLVGGVVHNALPALFGDIVTVEVETIISWKAVVEGFVLGILITPLFALLPLLGVRNISPLSAIRMSYNNAKRKFDLGRFIVVILILSFITAFAYIQMNDFAVALVFSLVTFLSFLLLFLTAKALMFLLRKYFPKRISFNAKQGLSNLFRPNNQTITLVVTIGLGTALIATLYFIQNSLIHQVSISGNNDQPNMVLYDIQPNEIDSVVSFMAERDMPVIQKVPIIDLQLKVLNGFSIEDVKADSSLPIPTWIYDRGYVTTYRDSLMESESTIEGQWPSAKLDGGLAGISVAEWFMKQAKLKVGDKITFDLHGVSVSTQIVHVRKVDWRRVQSNWAIVFQDGFLEDAPHKYAIHTRTSSEEKSLYFQRDIVKKYPSTIVIGIDQILTLAKDILSKLAFIIQFIAIFSILTGLLVLVSSINMSKYQRIRENNLLRIHGAKRKNIVRIMFFEYLLLGFTGSLVGIIISLFSSWMLAEFSFKSPFVPGFAAIGVIVLSITIITVIIGVTNSLSVLKKTPMEAYRSVD